MMFERNLIRKSMDSERSARSRKSAQDFDKNFMRKSMISERPTRSRKSARGALELHIDDFDKQTIIMMGKSMVSEAC